MELCICLSCRKKTYLSPSSPRACSCGGTLTPYTPESMVSIPTVMSRMSVCALCAEYGTHTRGGKRVEGCGLLEKPCSLGKMQTLKEWTGPEGWHCWDAGETEIQFKKGRVGFLSVVYMPIGGTETWHQTLLPRLEGVSGFVCFNKESSNGDYRALKVPYGVGMEAARKLAASIDVLVVWGVGGDLAQVLHTTNRPKVISVSHCDSRSGWTRDMMEGQAPWTDHCVYICPSGLETVPTALRSQSSLIPNAPDPDRCRRSVTAESVRRNLGVPDTDTLLVVVSRISPEKHIQKLMEAVTLLGPGWSLRIFGKSAGWSRSHRGELRRYENSRVKIMDPIKIPGDVLGAADGLLAASEYEGFGLSIAEAMTAGVPVISTPVGLLETDPNLAAIVPLHASPEEWAERIAQDYGKTKEQAKRVSYAKLEMEKTYSIENFVNAWDSLVGRVRGAR